MTAIDQLKLADEHFKKLNRELEIAFKERQHVAGLLQAAAERVLRLRVATNNAFAEREMKRAVLSSHKGEQK